MPLDTDQKARLAEHRNQNERADLQEALTFAEKAPDAPQYRNIARMSEESGIPHEVVERNQSAVEGQLNLTRVDPQEMLRNAPATAQWLQQGNNAPMSKDNFEVMQSLEKASRATPNLLPNTGRLINERVDQFLGNLVEFAGTVEEDFTKAVHTLGIPQPGIVFGPDGMSFDWDVGPEITSGESGSALRQFGERKSNLKSGYVPNFTWENFKGDMTPANLGGYMVEQGLPSVVEMGAALVSLPAFIAANTQRLAEERVDVEGTGRDVDIIDLAKTMPAAVASSLLERFSGKGSLGVLTGQVRATGVRSGLREIGKSGVVEGATEFAQEHIEYIAERFGVGEMSLAEGFDRGLAAAVVGTGMGTTLRGVSVLGEVATNRAERNVSREINSSIGQTQLDRMVSDIAGNTLLQESPEKMGEFLREIGPEDNIYINPEGVQAAIDAGLPVPKHMADQLGNDQDVVVPLDKFGLDLVPSDELMAQLRPHMKRDPAHLTQSEIQTRDDTGVKDMIARAAEHKEVLTEAENIHASITQQLVATGRMSTYSAKYSAQLIPAYVTTKVAELRDRGIDVSVEQIYRDMNFRVERLNKESSIDGEILQQARDSGFQGLSQGQAVEWVRGVEKFGEEGMTPEARLERAREQGYDVENVLYHGTNVDIRKIDTRSSQETGEFFVSSDAKVADDFATWRRTFEGSNIMPVVVRGKLLEIDGGGREIRDVEATAMDNIEVTGINYGDDIRAHAKRNGYDGIKFVNVVDDVMATPTPGKTSDIVAMINPNAVRSVNAAFDPDFKDKPYVLAQSPVQDPQAELQADRDAMGFYSAVEQAVIDMKIPQWKNNGEVSGNDIFAKLKKTPGVKEEEILWTGIEEFLTGVPKSKFPRSAVLAFVKQNGVNVEETVATEDDIDVDQEMNFDWSETIDDDSSQWDWRVDDYVYEFKRTDPEDRTDEFYFWDEDKARDDWTEQYGTEPTENQMEDRFREAAEKSAEEEYMENPITEYFDSNTSITISGNDDMGYRISSPQGEVDSEISSFNEAEVQAFDHAREYDLMEPSVDDETIAKWGPAGADYITDQIDGDYPENYVEMKLKLPDMPFDFYQTVHFPDRNIVAFIRATDRDIPVALPEDIAPADPTPVTEITPEVLAAPTPPETMFFHKFKKTWAQVKEDGGIDTTLAEKNWTKATEEQRRHYLSVGNEQIPNKPSRYNDKVDTFFVDEMQSDLQQHANTVGVKQGLDVGQLDMEAREIKRELDEMASEAFNEILPMAIERYNDEVAVGEEIIVPEHGVFPYQVSGRNGWDTMNETAAVQYIWDLVRNDMDAKKPSGQLEHTERIKAALAADLEASDKFDIEKAKDIVARYDAKDVELKRERTGAPDAPFKKDAWLTMAMKRAIMHAVRTGSDGFAWADAGVIEDRWNSDAREAYMNQYNRKMPSIVKKLLKIQPVHLNMEGQPYVNEDFSKWEVLPHAENRGWSTVFDARGEAVWHGPDSDQKLTAEEAKKRAMDIAMENWNIPEGYWAVPLTPELKESVRAQGFTLFQEGDAQPRGEIQLLDEERIIRLSNTSDLSTFLHETGHLFLESEKMLADKYGHSANQEAILKMLGVESFEDIGREEHELFARTFEDYLRTGKAPSMRLRDAFAAFARWLSHIYANIARIGTKLEPEVVELFDRLLATEVETQEVLTASPFIQYFKTQEQAGVSDKQWEEYLKKVEKRNSRTQMTLTEKVLKEYRQRRSAEWKEERDPLVQEEEARLALTPAYQMLEDLKNEKMDYHAVAKVLGVTKLPTGKILSNSKTGGQDPEALTEKYGYDTVKDMLAAVTETHNITKQATANAQAAMVEKYGDILNDGTLDQEVRDAAHNDAEKELLLAELRMIAKSKRKKPVDRKQVAYEANKLIMSMRHVDINPDKFYRAEIRAAEKDGKGKSPAENAQNKETQLTNHYLYREAMNVKRDVEKQIKYLKAAWTRKYSLSKVDGEYANAIRQYSGMYNAKRKPEERRAAAEKFLTFLKGQQTGGVNLTLKDQNILAAMDVNGNLDPNFQLKRFSDLTADEVYSVYEMVKHLRYVGGVEAVAKNAELKGETDTVIAAIRKSGTARARKDEQTRMDTLRNSFSHIINTLPNLRNFVRNLDGDWKSVGGDVFDTIYRRVDRAENVKLVTTRQFYKDFEERMGDFSALGLDDSRSSKEKVQRAARPDDPFSLTANGRFMLAVYWGTESSRDAIMAGHDVTEGEVLEMISHLTPEQLELVNKFWAFNETMAAPLFEAGIKRDGVAPAKLPAAPFEVNGVRMTGGHMTLHYTMAAPEVRLDQGSLAMDMQTGLVPSKATALHSRTGSGGRMVDLNTHNITKSIDENAHYIGYAEIGMELQRILGNKETKQAIIDTRGEGFYRAFMQSLQGVTTNRVEAEMYPWLAHAVTTLKSAKSAMYLMWNMKNIIQQMGSLYPAIRSAGPQNYVREATRMYGTGFNANVEFVHSKSPQMANRIAHMNRESAEALKNAVRNTPHAKIYAKVMQSGFTPHVILDLGISYPLWMAHYNASLERTGDEAQAAIDADVAVNEAVGTGLDIGMGKALHSNQSAHIKLLTLFGSWFNSTVFQRAYTATKGGTDFANAKAIEALFITPAITMMISEAIVMNIPGAPWGDEEEGEYEGFLMWFIKSMARFNSAAIPLMGGMVSEIDGFSPKTLLQEAQALPGTTIDSINKARQGEMSAAEGFEQFVKIVGTVVPLPGSGNAVRMADFAESFNQGEEGDNINVIDMYQAVVEGRDKNRK